jgi:glycosyltransferase involved in cell wall biosynthesis
MILSILSFVNLSFWKSLMNSAEFVSCVMVTKMTPTRHKFFIRSLRAFAEQDYPSTELVILSDQDDPSAWSLAADHVAKLGDARIRLLPAVRGNSLGRLRNLAAEAARGAVICQWDDDDLSHPSRISRQFDHMTQQGAGACYLQDVMQLLAGPRELYWTNWRMTPTGAHPGTLMCRRHVLPAYPDLALDEDRAVFCRLNEATKIALLSSEPHLFIYVTHDGNAWPSDHHRMLIDRLAISQALLRRRESELRGGLRPLDFGPDPVVVMGSNGPAFTLEPEHSR